MLNFFFHFKHFLVQKNNVEAKDKIGQGQLRQIILHI